MSKDRIELPSELEPYKQRIESTIKPYIEIKAKVDNQMSLWQSKFGGFPYLPKNIGYPTNSKGEYLLLLAQINFYEVFSLVDFPKTGILQFYILPDEYYGRNLQNPVDRDNFRVLYFSEPTYNLTKIVTKFDLLPRLQSNTDIFPIKNSCSLDFYYKAAPISVSDGHFAFQTGHELYRLLSSNTQLWNKYAEIADYGSKIGGYPAFVAEGDERFYHLPDDNYEEFILLLQIDSNGSGKNICWKNSDGVGNFFIEPSALKRLDFSNVFYAWDCSDRD